MFFLAWGWDHSIIRVWLIAGIVLAVYFLGRALFDWKRSLEEAIREQENQESTSRLTRQAAGATGRETESEQR